MELAVASEALEPGRPGGPSLPTELAFRQHAPELLGYLRGIVRDEAAAEDLVQDAFLRLHAETAAGRSPMNTRAWLFRVAGNLAMSRGRHLQVAARHAPRLQVIDGGSVAAEDVVVRHEYDGEVVRALATLRPLDREILLLAASGRSGPEIARLLGRSDVATRTLLCRARHRLRDSIDRAERG